MLVSVKSISSATVALRSAALIGSKAVQDALLSLLFIWLARIDQSGYGLVVLGLSVVMLLRSLQSMGLDQYTLRELSSFQTRTASLLRQMARIKIVIAGLMICGVLTFVLFKQWSLHQVFIITIMLCGQCFEGIADTFFNLLRAEGQSINESICRTGPNIVAAVYGAGCLFLHLDISFFVLLFLLGGGLKLSMAIFAASRLRHVPVLKGGHVSFQKMEIKSLFLISAISFFGIFYNEIQVFWLKHYFTFIDISHYRVASDVTVFVSGAVAQLIIGAVLFPLLVKLFPVNEYEFRVVVRSYFKKTIILGSGVVFFLSFFGGKIVLFIYGNEYLPAQSLVPVFGVAAFFSFINNFIVYVLLAMKKEKLLFFCLFAPVTISILLGPILVADKGPVGAASSLLLSRVMLSIVLVTILQRKIRFFKLRWYTDVVFYWLIAATVFGLLVQINYFFSGSMAILVYFLLVWLGPGKTELWSGNAH